jgi:hypothetical protein
MLEWKAPILMLMISLSTVLDEILSTYNWNW